MTELREAWAQLEASAQKGSAIDQVRLFGDEPLNLLAVFRPDTKHVGIQLDVLAASVPAVGLFPSPGAFVTTSERFGDRTRISVFLAKSEFKDVFTEMCADLLLTCRGASSETQAVRALHSRLHTWRELFLGSGPVPLSEAEQLGLFGELTFLLASLDHGIAPAAAIGGWYGPKRHHHDFHFDSVHVEVKATEAQSMVVSVSSLAQLDSGKLEHLFLWQFELRHDPTGISLPGLVHLIRERLAIAGSSAEFNLLLICARYLDSHSSNYAEVLYLIARETVFAVESGFPSLTRNTVDEAVRQATYAFDLGLVPTKFHITSVDAFAAILAGLNTKK